MPHHNRMRKCLKVCTQSAILFEPHNKLTNLFAPNRLEKISIMVYFTVSAIKQMLYYFCIDDLFRLSLFPCSIFITCPLMMRFFRDLHIYCYYILNTLSITVSSSCRIMHSQQFISRPMEMKKTLRTLCKIIKHTRQVSAILLRIYWLITYLCPLSKIKLQILSRLPYPICLCLSR